jgi:hypothetical protein
MDAIPGVSGGDQNQRSDPLGAAFGLDDARLVVRGGVPYAIAPAQRLQG